MNEVVGDGWGGGVMNDEGMNELVGVVWPEMKPGKEFERRKGHDGRI